MILTETKTEKGHYFTDSLGNYQGLVKKTRATRGYVIGFAKNGHVHGEIINFDEYGDAFEHRYYYSNNFDFLDLLKNPIIDPEEKMVLKLKHGGNWIAEEDKLFFADKKLKWPK